MKKTLIALTLLAGLWLCGPSAAQPGPVPPLPDNVPALLAKANETYARKDYPAHRRVLEKLCAMRPNNSEYMYRLVIAHALLGEKPEAYSLMLRMQQQGLAYDFAGLEETRGIRGTEVFDYLSELMALAAQPLGESRPVFTLPADLVMPEAIAWDQSRQRFLVGTLADGRIVAVTPDGQAEELLRADEANGLWSVFDILPDESRNRLWVSSAATPLFSNFDLIDKGRSALFEFDLQTLELVRKHPVPADGRAHVLGNMVQGPGGDIYIADRVLPILYRKPAGEGRLEAVLVSPGMVSLRGVAMQPDGKLLYLADREMGILVVDLEASRAAKLAIPDTLNLGGIDGLYLWKNRLIAVQNGIRPQRVMRLQLDASGTQVTAVRPLAVAQPDFDGPSFGTVRGDDLYYFAASRWSPGGEPQKPVTVLRTNLDANEDIVPPDVSLFLERERKRAEAGDGQGTD